MGPATSRPPSPGRAQPALRRARRAAAAVANGLALSKLRAYQAGFLIFSDFQRGALRLSALMELPLIHLYARLHRGRRGVGPTHQPIDELRLDSGPCPA